MVTDSLEPHFTFFRDACISTSLVLPRGGTAVSKMGCSCMHTHTCICVRLCIIIESCRCNGRIKSRGQWLKLKGSSFACSAHCMLAALIFGSRAQAWRVSRVAKHGRAALVYFNASRCLAIAAQDDHVWPDRSKTQKFGWRVFVASDHKYPPRMPRV